MLIRYLDKQRFLLIALIETHKQPDFCGNVALHQNMSGMLIIVFTARSIAGSRHELIRCLFFQDGSKLAILVAMLKV